jgi:serine/threonine protein kinase
MRIVTAPELENWLANGKVLEKDGRGPKVVALHDGDFLKIFYTRRHPLIARLRPAAKRFASNAETLLKLGIAAPKVTECFWLNPKKGLSACLYQPLPGQSIEQLYKQSPERVQDLLPDLAGFILSLHRAGIYFRSLHLGNILLLPSGGFGLIDILDLKVRARSLGTRLVRRNFQHLSRYLARNKIESFPLNKLLALYRDAS